MRDRGHGNPASGYGVQRDRRRPIGSRGLSACKEAGLRTLDLREQPMPSGLADCVLACDVLEHVEDDFGMLLNLRRALRPNGCLLVTVPAYEFLWSGEDYVSEHVRRYRRSTLLEKSKPAGLEPAWSSYFNTFLFPLVAATILAKRIFRPRECMNPTFVHFRTR